MWSVGDGGREKRKAATGGLLQTWGCIGTLNLEEKRKRWRSADSLPASPGELCIIVYLAALVDSATVYLHWWIGNSAAIYCKYYIKRDANHSNWGGASQRFLDLHNCVYLRMEGQKGQTSWLQRHLLFTADILELWMGPVVFMSLSVLEIFKSSPE